MRPEVNITVGGSKKSTNYTYKTVVLKNNLPFAAQIGEPNCIYVIKWDFDLNGETVTIPENCVLQFEGGSVINGTVTINEDTVVVDIFHSAGGSDNRPLIAHAGFMYFDTYLSIPVWFNGIKWIKADGTDADIANNEQI